MRASSCVSPYFNPLHDNSFSQLFENTDFEHDLCVDCPPEVLYACAETGERGESGERGSGAGSSGGDREGERERLRQSESVGESASASRLTAPSVYPRPVPATADPYEVAAGGEPEGPRPRHGPAPQSE